MKRLILLLAAVVLLLSGCSPRENPVEESPLGAYGNTGETHTVKVPPRHYISLIFYEDMDTHPLTTQNKENHELLKLVYSPLVRLDDRLKVHFVLAENVLVEGTEVTVYLRPNLKFSDGSPLTAADVVSSFKTVRNNPTSPYYERLTNVKRYTAKDDRTVLITLHRPDVDFAGCLDIPVVQKKSGLGSGPYLFSEQGGERVLVPNANYFLQTNIGTIYLKKPANETQRQDMFSVGLLDVYFTTAESTSTFTGGKNFRTQTYGSDNLLFLGVNCSTGPLSNAALRHYLSGLVGREKLVQSVLLNQAEPTAYPFRSAWYKAEELVQDRNWTDQQKKEKAAALGLTLSENMLLNKAGAQLTFRLMVQEGSEVHKSVSQAVADSYALSGIRILPETVSREVYNTRLAAGDYELYLGEIKTGRSLNTALFAAGSAVNFSKADFSAVEQAAAAYIAGEKTLAEFAAAFDAATPVIPLTYRRGVLYAAADIGDFKDTGTWALYGDVTQLVTLETELSKE